MVLCFGVRDSGCKRFGAFHLMHVHTIFSSVSVAEWPLFGK